MSGAGGGNTSARPDSGFGTFVALQWLMWIGEWAGVVVMPAVQAL